MAHLASKQTSGGPVTIGIRRVPAVLQRANSPDRSTTPRRLGSQGRRGRLISGCGASPGLALLMGVGLHPFFWPAGCQAPSFPFFPRTVGFSTGDPAPASPWSRHQGSWAQFYVQGGGVHRGDPALASPWSRHQGSWAVADRVSVGTLPWPLPILPGRGHGPHTIRKRRW